MPDIKNTEFGRDFAQCWRAARRHLNRQVKGGIQSWIKRELTPPFVEHLSFRLGKHIFFIQLADVDDRLEIPGSLRDLERIAQEQGGHACLMPMRRDEEGWKTVETGWGLINAHTCLPIDPAAWLEPLPGESVSATLPWLRLPREG